MCRPVLFCVRKFAPALSPLAPLPRMKLAVPVGGDFGEGGVENVEERRVLPAFPPHQLPARNFTNDEIIERVIFVIVYPFKSVAIRVQILIRNGADLRELGKAVCSDDAS